MKIEIDYLHFHNLNRNVLDLGSKVRDLTEENKRLKYEAVHDAGQLGEQSAEIASLRAEVERLNSAVNYWRIEAECDHGRWLRCLEDLEKLRASSFVTAVPSHQYERVIKAGDNLVFVASEHPVAEPFVKAWFAAKNGWDDAKEGKQL